MSIRVVKSKNSHQNKYRKMKKNKGNNKKTMKKAMNTAKDNMNKSRNNKKNNRNNKIYQIIVIRQSIYSKGIKKPTIKKEK